MDKRIVDCKGTELAVGQRVVFNFSGNLASGTIIEIKEKWRKAHYLNQLYFDGSIVIKRDRGYEYNHANTDVSKVKNLQGIYVL